MLRVIDQQQNDCWAMQRRPHHQGRGRRRALSRRMLTDAQWERIAGYLPGREGTPGRSGVDNRMFVDAILWMAGTAAHWRDLPEAFGKWTAVHARFRRWSRSEEHTSELQSLMSMSYAVFCLKIKDYVK